MLGPFLAICNLYLGELVPEYYALWLLAVSVCVCVCVCVCVHARVGGWVGTECVCGQCVCVCILQYYV